MSNAVEVPQWLRAKSGEQMSERFLAWIQTTQKKLLGAFPNGERSFCRIVDKMRSRMRRRWHSRFYYTRQKYFVVTPEIVYFGDFYFSNMRLLVEIDGSSHDGPAAKEKDNWHDRLIETWKARTVRFTNDEVMCGDFRCVEEKLIDACGLVLPSSIDRKLREDYQEMRHRHLAIYSLTGVITTKRR